MNVPNSPDLQALIDRYTAWQPGVQSERQNGGWSPSATALAMMGQGTPMNYWQPVDDGSDIPGNPAGDGGDPNSGGTDMNGLPVGGGGGGGYGNYDGGGGNTQYSLPGGDYSGFNSPVSDGSGIDWSALSQYLPSSQTLENLLGSSAAGLLGGPLAGMVAGVALNHYNPAPKQLPNTPNINDRSQDVSSDDMDYWAGTDSPNGGAGQGADERNGSDVESDQGGMGSGSTGNTSSGFKGVYDLSGGMSTMYGSNRSGGSGSGSGSGSSGGGSGGSSGGGDSGGGDSGGGGSGNDESFTANEFATGGSVNRALPKVADATVIQQFINHGMTAHPQLAQFAGELKQVMGGVQSAMSKRPDGKRMQNYLRAEYLHPIAGALRSNDIPGALKLMTELMEEAHKMTGAAS